MTDAPRFAVLLSDNGDVTGVWSTLASLADQTSDQWTLYVAAGCVNAVENAAALDVLGLTERATIVERGCHMQTLDTDWVLPLLPGDELTVDAIAEFGAAIAEGRSDALVYADHAEYSKQLGECVPFFKPGWSPEFLIATDYIGRAAVRTRLFSNSIRTSSYGAVDLWALHLSIARMDDIHVSHIERVLVSLCSCDRRTLAKDAEYAQQVLKRHLAAIGLAGRPRWADWARRLEILSFEIDFADDGPSVAILIPSRNNAGKLKVCVDSLSKTTYTNFQVIVIDNDSDDPKALAYLNTAPVRMLKISSPPTGFSYAHINNRAVEKTDSEYVLFLNDDTEVISPRWLSQMVGWLQIDCVASVGARLLFPNDRIQHVGIVHGMLDEVLPGLPYRWMHRNILGPRGQDRVIKNYSAMSAACLLMRRADFLTVGGFDEESFAVAYNDCDLGFRLVTAGRRHVYEPGAELYHYEGASRGSGRNNDRISEEIAFIDKYRNWKDPYFNQNLSLDGNGIRSKFTRLLSSMVSRGQITIALFTHNLNYEGAPLVLFEIAQGLRIRNGASVTVFSPQDGKLREKYRAIGCTVELVPVGEVYQAKTGDQFDKSILEVMDRLAIVGADVVISNTILLHWGMIAAQRLGIPSVWIIHESEPPFEHLMPHGAIQVERAAEAMKQAAATVFVSNATRDLYQDVPKHSPAEVIYNGFDMEQAQRALDSYDRRVERERLGIGSDEIVVLMPGTVCERKAQIDLVAAAEQLPDDLVQRMRFMIVGAVDNEYTRLLRKAVDSLPDRLRQRVEVHNLTPEIFKYYICADMMAFTSRLESFPRVIQEAMFFGLAITTTPVFGIAEQLVDGKTGLFYPAGNINRLAAQLETLARNPELRMELGQQAKLSLRRFPTIEEMQDKYWYLVQCVAEMSHVSENALAGIGVCDTSIGRASWWEEFVQGCSGVRAGPVTGSV